MRHELRLVPNDPAMTAVDPLIGPMPTSGTSTGRDFPAAWDLSRGTGAIVGIIDSGIDSGHPDLAGKIRSAHDHDGTRRDGRRGRPRDARQRARVRRPDNGFGIAGGGLDCQMVLEKSDLTSSSVIASLVDAARCGAGVINMSFGGGRLSAARSARSAMRCARTSC